MAKIIAPPAIHNLDNFLDMLLNQEKYIEYLKQLKVMKDEILALLDILDTNEKATENLAKAQYRLQEAENVLRQARSEAEKIHAASAAKQAAVEAAEHELEERIVRVDRDLTAKGNALTNRHTEIVATEQAVAKREQLADAREAELQRRMQVLDEELAKLRKKKDLLAEIN